MKASVRENEFIGRVPGLDCKSEWLLGFGSKDFRFGVKEEDLEITLIVKLDEGIRPLFEHLRDKGSRNWYVFLDGTVVAGKADKFNAALEEVTDKSGRYMLAYIPLSDLREALKSTSISLSGNGLVMTSSLRQTDGNPGKYYDSVGEQAGVDKQSIFVEKGTVFMGIIDDGIAVAHDRFLNSDGSNRVRYFWDQRDHGKSNSLDRLIPYGQEFEGDKINNSDRRVSDRSGDVGNFIANTDEEVFYRTTLSELADPNRSDTRLMRAANHGTHVLDLAAGGHDDSKRPVIAVQLPPRTVADTSGITFFDQYVMSGLLYILERAKRYKIEGTDDYVPVVINFSFGTLAGPHDGTHQIERLFDEAVEKQKGEGQEVRLIVPAGNSHQSRCHAEFPIEANREQVLFWRLQPEDLSPSWLHIWLPPGELSELTECPFELTITPPGRDTLIGALDRKNSVRLHVDDDEDRVIGLATYTVTRSEQPRGHLCIALRPTASLQPIAGSDQPIAPSGLWRIGIKFKSHLNDRLTANDKALYVQAWIERDDTAFGYRQYGRQSYFDHPDYEVYDKQGRPYVDDDGNESIVKRGGLINAIATGRNTIIVGAVRADNNKPSGYSAGGPSRYTFPGKPAIDRYARDMSGSPALDGHDEVVPVARNGVDLLAVADDSAIHGGIIAAGTYSGSAVALNGTSVAAPQVARVVADDLAAGKTGSLSALQKTCSAPEGTASAMRAGFGTIDKRRDRRRRVNDGGGTPFL